MKKLILLELNEVNFDYVQRYIDKGYLPNFSRLLDQYGVVETTSEERYEHIEPWIQWVTAHTGMSLAEHGLFRLGDVHSTEIEQIWEHLERRFECSVLAISPMNASNRTKDAPLFVPDPWTGGDVSGSDSVRRLYESISRMVNENATGRTSMTDLLRLGSAVLRYCNNGSFSIYLRKLLGVPNGTWRRALVLDLLLADIFTSAWRKHLPDFSSLFLNAAAHIQHHYLFNSSAYDGPETNPAWYIRDDVDPVLEVYELYDRVVGTFSALPETRLMIATGLHQDPHDRLTYYYRLREHERFLRKVGIQDFEVLPRMSRDFLVKFATTETAASAELKIRQLRSADGEPVFSVDNRGQDLFCMLEYAGPIEEGFVLCMGDRKIHNFADDVAFVAIKNGQHNGVGYFLDTGVEAARDHAEVFPLTGLFDRIVGVFEETNTSGLPRQNVAQGA